MNIHLQQFLQKYPYHFYGKGQVILRPEHEEYQVFFVDSGYIRAHTITEEGNEFSAVLLGPGMYFPIFRYLSDSIYTKKLATKYYYSAVTEAKLTQISTIELVQFLEINPSIAIEMADIYYVNMKLLQSNLEFMVYTHSAYKKVCYFLLYICRQFGKKKQEGIALIPPFTHKEFATFVGLSRESVSHQLSVLRKKKILQELHANMYVKNIFLLENELRK